MLGVAVEHGLIGGESASSGPESEEKRNLCFVEGDVADVPIGTGDDATASFLVCIHACNEANKIALDLAAEARSRGVACGWAVMPCCIPNGLYIPNKVRDADDATCYALKCGFIAGLYGADRMGAIDARITNRNCLLTRGWALSEGEGGEEGR